MFEQFDSTESYYCIARLFEKQIAAEKFHLINQKRNQFPVAFPLASFPGPFLFPPLIKLRLDLVFH